MALKFLNKKGWHTGSLRNIENVWKAEQKHEAEQKKLEELRKQIQDEREQSEFRQLQEQAGLVPKQERLEFLYDSGLAVGKSSESFQLSKPGETQKNETENELDKLAAVPGALFVVEKPASANDTWRKLHSDPLLMIRQREQEALAQIKNNPVKMEMIKKSMEAKTHRKEEKERRKAEKKKHKKEKRKRQASSDSDSDINTNTTRKKMRPKDKSQRQSTSSDSETEVARGINNGQDMKNKRDHLKDSMGRQNSSFQIPPNREHLAGSQKQQERRYNQERSRSPLHYRQHRSRSPLEYGGSHRSRSPSDYRKSLRHGESHRSRSPPKYKERHRSRSPSDHGKSLHHRQRHRSRSPSVYVRRHRSHSPSDYGRHGAHSPDSRRHRLPPDHRKSSALNLQDRGNDSHARGTDSRPTGEKQSADLDIHRKSSALHLQDRENNSHARGTDSRPTGEKQSAVLDITSKQSAVPDITSKPASRPKYQAGKLSEEEKAARLREMQIDAELHDEQRWQRLKKASDADAREAIEAARGSGKNFLDATTKSVYGAEKGGSSTIEESVRRRTHFLQGSTAASEGNAFRR